MHKHLQRQLRRLDIDETRPPSAAEWQELLTWISETYGNMDRERYLVEHSIEISSCEMREFNAKISEERDKFASIFKATPSGMAIVDTSGIVVEVNQALSDMLGYLPDDMTGREVIEFFAPEEREGAKARIGELASAQITVVGDSSAPEPKRCRDYRRHSGPNHHRRRPKSQDDSDVGR